MNGYIWPEFGHGEPNICGEYDSIMAYGNRRWAHSNSLYECTHLFPNDAYNYDGLQGGDRTISDEAYAINRVRYNVSLINEDEPVALDNIERRPVVECPAEMFINTSESPNEYPYASPRR